MREKLGYYAYTVTTDRRLELLNLALSFGIEIYGESEIDECYSVRVSLFDATVWENALIAGKIPFTRGELRGVLGAFQRLTRHPGLICGMVLAVLMYVWLGGVVWEVRITTENDIDEDVVLSELAEAGLHEGVWAAGIDPDNIVAEFLALDDGVAFAAVHLRGVVAEVVIIQREAPLKEEPSEDPCNLVAMRDAVVTDMTVYAGKPTVKIGQTVAAGDLLVTGVLTDVGGTRLLPAAATVMGRVEDTTEVEVPLALEGRRVIASHTRFLSITAFGHSFTVGRREGADCIRERRLYLFDRIRLPFIVQIGCSTETEVTEQIRSQEEAQNIAETELRRRLSIMLADGALESCETTVETEDGVLRLSARVVYETNIAKSLAFSIENK